MKKQQRPSRIGPAFALVLIVVSVGVVFRSLWLSVTSEPPRRYSVTLISHGEAIRQWTARGQPTPHYFKAPDGYQATWHFIDDRSGAPVAIQSLTGAVICEPAE